MRNKRRNKKRNGTNCWIHGHEPAAQSYTTRWLFLALPTRGRISTKGSCVDDDEDEEELQTDISYLCKLFAGDPPRLVAIGRVYATGLTIHTVSLKEGLSRVVVEKVRHANVEVQEPRSEVRFVGQALGTFIAWPTHLLKVISKKHKVWLLSFLFMLFKFTLNFV